MASSSENNKISIVLPHLILGGAEVVHLKLANELRDQGFEIEFVIVDPVGELFESTKKDFKLVSLNQKRLFKSLIPLKNYFDKAKPKYVLAAMWPMTSISIWALKLSSANSKILVSDHGKIDNFSNSTFSFLSRLKLKLSLMLSYRFADSVVAVSNGLRLQISKMASLSLDKTHTIHNPAARGSLPEEKLNDEKCREWMDAEKRIIAIGRLKPVKAFDLLIKAFSKIDNLENSHLLILGDGHCKNELVELCKELGIESKVSFRGFVEDTYPYLIASNLFALTSKNEGFGNVIVEALECGTPIIATDCDYGPREILSNGKYGRLVPVDNLEKLITAINEELIGNKIHKPDLSVRAKDFLIKNVTAKYLNTLR